MYLPTSYPIDLNSSLDRQIEPHSFQSSKSRRSQRQNSGANLNTYSSGNGPSGVNGSSNNSNTNTSSIANFHNSTYQPPANGLTTRGTSRFCITNEYAGIDQWGFGMWRKPAKDIYNLERDLEFRQKYLRSIREFGYDYLKPPGIKQTMQSLLERDAQSDEEVEPQRDGEIDLDALADQQQEEEEISGIRQQQIILGVENEENDGRNNGHGHDTEDTEDIGNERINEVNREINSHEGDEEEADLDADIPDLDAQVPEAGDNSYDDSYDEEEYQEGFMADEEYDDGGVEDDGDLAEGEYDRQDRTPAPTGVAVAVAPDQSNLSSNMSTHHSMPDVYDISQSSISMINDDDSEQEMDVSNISFQ